MAKRSGKDFRIRSSEDAIVIMAKEPKPKCVKTRLTPPLEPETASHLYYNFLCDKIQQVTAIEEITPFVAYTPKSSLPIFEKIVPEGFTLIVQKGTDLGERLENISKTLFSQGFGRVVILDSDTPNLPLRFIREGIENLEDVDMVLGPCSDGGYYLIGLRSHIPELFRGIPWSTSEVTESTLKKAQDLDMSISLLNDWYDVDTMDDLLRLKRDLYLPSDKQQDSFFCENTYRILSNINIT